VRNAYRIMHVRRREADRTSHDGQLNDWPENPRSSRLNEQACNRVTASLAELLHRLDPRERFIISGRYALGDHDQVETFQSLADTLGLSKERVRQLEQRAVAKMRQWYGELRIDSVVDPIVDESISVR
jgi:RNA polymerase primary sigma factor